MNKKIDAVRAEKKRLKGGILIMIIFGTVFIIIGIGVFFGYCRPFTKWVYYKCVVKNKEWFEIDSTHYKVIYFVDDIEYEKTFLISDGRSGFIAIGFYYNEADPNDVVLGNRDTLLWAMPVTICVGISFITIGIIQYKNEMKKLLKKKR